MRIESRAARGAMWGLLVGDALGVPYEFHPAVAIPPDIAFSPALPFRRSYPDVPPGTWSDDGAQALCLLECLLERGHLDLEHFGARLADFVVRVAGSKRMDVMPARPLRGRIRRGAQR